MAKKKGGKGKKKKDKALPILTTIKIEEERLTVFAPRLGDAFFKLNNQSEMSNDHAQIRILNTVERESSTLCLSHMRLLNLDLLFNIKMSDKDFGMVPLIMLQEIDLSRNELFNTEDVFQVRIGIKNYSILCFN